MHLTQINLSLRTLGAALLGFLVLIAILIAVVTYRLNQQVTSAVRALAEGIAPALAALEEMNTGIWRAHLEALSLAVIQEEDEEEAESEIEELLEAGEAIEENLTRYSTLFPNTDTVDIAAIDAATDDMINTALAFVEAVEEVEEGEATEEAIFEAKAAMEAAEDDYLDVLGRGLAQTQASFAEKQANIAGLTQTMSALSVVLTALIIVFTLIAGFISQRLIIAPVLTLKGVAQRITEGEYRHQVPIKTGNEVEELADAFYTMAGTLEGKIEEANDAVRFKTQLLARISHELRTPLGAVIGMAGALKADALGEISDQQREVTGQIIRYADELRFLIDELLEQSRLELAGDSPTVATEDVALETLLGHLEMRMRSAAQHKGLVFEVSKGDDLPETIKTDPNKLTLILNNLVSNAIKFTDEGQIRVHTMRSSDDEIRFEVQDTGVGIPQDQHDVVFAEFRQGDESITRQYGGIGLGLSLVKQFSELLGGNVTVESEPGNGSTFTVTLPITKGAI